MTIKKYKEFFKKYYREIKSDFPFVFTILIAMTVFHFFDLDFKLFILLMILFRVYRI